MGANRTAKLEALSRAPLFEGLSRKDLGLVARAADEVEVAAGRPLFAEGETGREFFVVVEGEAEVTRNGRHLMTCRAGDFLGDISLIAQTSRRASATATTPMRLFVISRERFLHLLDEHPKVERKVLRSLAVRVLAGSSEPTL